MAQGAVCFVFVSRDITHGVWLAEVSHAEAWWRMDMRGRRPHEGLIKSKDAHKFMKAVAASAVK